MDSNSSNVATLLPTEAAPQLSGTTEQHLEPESSNAMPIEASGAEGLRVLRLRGLPFAAGPDDVRGFFSAAGYELAEVFICRRNGRANGEAYVVLDGDQAPAAMAALNRSHLGARYIEIFEARESELQTAKALTVDRLRGYVVRLRGLPYSASATDVLRFLDGVDVVRGIEGVIFTWTPDGRPTGEAFVELQDAAAHSRAMKKHKEMMGSRYIELFSSTKAAMVQAIQHNRLILGFSSRRKWLQQAGLPQQGPHQVAGLPGRSSGPVPGGASVEDVTHSLVGMRVGGLGGGSVQHSGGSMHSGGGLHSVPGTIHVLTHPMEQNHSMAQGQHAATQGQHAGAQQQQQHLPLFASLQAANSSGYSIVQQSPSAGMHHLSSPELSSSAHSARHGQAGMATPSQQLLQPIGQGHQHQGYSQLQQHGLIQGAPGQFVTLDSNLQGIGSPGGPATQYLLGPGGQAYMLQAIQLPSSSSGPVSLPQMSAQQVSDYLALSGSGSGNTTDITTHQFRAASLPIAALQPLATHSGEGGVQHSSQSMGLLPQQ